MTALTAGAAPGYAAPDILRREATVGGAMRAWLGVALIAAGASGCRNACQQLCVEMADYAEECNLAVPEGDVAACVERQSAPAPEDRDTCQEFGDAEVLRTQWDCDELARYWSGG